MLPQNSEICSCSCLSVTNTFELVIKQIIRPYTMLRSPVEIIQPTSSLRCFLFPSYDLSPPLVGLYPISQSFIERGGS